MSAPALHHASPPRLWRTPDRNREHDTSIGKPIPDPHQQPIRLLLGSAMKIELGTPQKRIGRFNLCVRLAHQLAAKCRLALAADAIEYENARTIGGNGKRCVLEDLLPAFAIDKGPVNVG